MHTSKPCSVESVVAQGGLLESPEFHLDVAVRGVSLQFVSQLGNRGGLVVSLYVLSPDRGSSSRRGLGIHVL